MKNNKFDKTDSNANILNYQEFLDSVLMKMKKSYPHCRIDIHDVRKNNGLILQGMQIQNQDTNLSPTIYLNSFYEMYLENHSIDMVVTEIQELYDNDIIHKNLDVSFLSDFEKVKECIIYRLINAEKNEELLNEIPHIPFKNMAICFYCTFELEPGISGSTLIKSDMAQIWKVETEKLMELAETNTHRILPEQFICIKDMLNKEDELKEGYYSIEPDEENEMYVLTNEEHYYGAAAILYPNVLNRLADRFKCDFFVIPSSIHEMIISLANSDIPISEQINRVLKLPTPFGVNEP